VPHEKKKRSTSAKSRPTSRANASKAEKRSRLKHRGKIRPRTRIGGNPRGKVGDVRKLRPLGRLLAALEEEEIPFILIGMSAAIAQGVMGSTLDVDLWIDLPSRSYMRVQNVARRLGATPAANTVVYLSDGTPVNFVYEVTGLGKFARELATAVRLRFHGRSIPVLPLRRIQKSKKAIGRDKDKLHLRQISEFLRCEKAAGR
jgi:hypothetical protein